MDPAALGKGKKGKWHANAQNVFATKGKTAMATGKELQSKAATKHFAKGKMRKDLRLTHSGGGANVGKATTFEAHSGTSAQGGMI